MNEYWRQREEQAQREYRLTEEEYIEELNGIYDYMLDRINEDIRSFYSRYASREGITYAEATERVSNTVIEEYERKAKKYIEEHDFSAQANEEMRIYNLTMRVNRLETLKAEIGLEMVDGFNELDTVLGEDLTERAVQEMARQSGILGMTVKDTARTANSIVGASFHNATFSERIWMYQDELKSQLDILLRQGLIQGRGPRELADQILKRFDVSRNEAERLMRTELCRVQTEAQKQSFVANGFDEYQYNALSTACPVCRALDGKHFRIVDMQVGENAPPLHPNCVTAGTKIIAPDAEAIMRSRYSGDIVEIRTANGTRLSVTPNHIVLTARGWVRAKNLVKGDKVIHYCGDVSDGVHAEPADDDSSPSIEDLFAAIVKASGGATLRVPVSPVDLKGDVVPDSEIDIVPFNGELRNKLDTATKKLVSDSLLVGTGKLGERELPFNSTLMTFLCGIGLVADGIMSGLRISEILLRGALGHHEMKSLRLGSDYDARLKKTATDGGTANAELLGDGVFAGAGIIKSDDFGRVQVVSDASERDVVVMKCSGDGGAVQSESVSDVLRRHTAFIKGDNLSNVLALSGAGQTDAVPVESISNDVATDAINISDVVDCFPTFVEFDNIEFVSIRKDFAGHVYDTSCMSTLYISNGIITSNCFCATSAYMDDATYNEWLDTYQNHGMSFEDWLENRPTAVERSKINRDYECDLAQALGKDGYDKLCDLVDDCEDENLKKLWGKYQGEIAVGNARYLGEPCAKENTIFFDMASAMEGNECDAPLKVIFHESSHAIDYLASKDGWYSAEYESGKFLSTIQSEVNQTIEKAGQTIKQYFENEQWQELMDEGFVFKWAYDEYQETGEWPSMFTPKYSESMAYLSVQKEISNLDATARGNISDIMQGATGGEIQAGVGHEDSYWENQNHVAMEAFAEFSDASFTNSESLEVMKQYLPESYSVWKDMVSEMSK